ncbi:hypothetical protein PENTCL1PPCAC_30061, partial [Pristionchus entomophagus]
FLQIVVNMATNVQLDSKQKLPQKVTDVICDISMMINNAIATSNSNDLMSSSFKAIVGSESTIENSTKMLNSISELLKDMDDKFTREGPVELGVMKLSDAQESLQRLERGIYGDKVESVNDDEHQRREKEGWSKSVALCSALSREEYDDDDDPDFLQMLKDRQLLPDNDEFNEAEMEVLIEAEMEAKQKGCSK